MSETIFEAANAFGLQTKGEPCGNGHINSTYIASKDGEPYILQLINTNVFKNPSDMMDNICKVTNHIKNKIRENGRDAERGVVSVLNTTDNKSFYVAKDGSAYRAYNFIKDSITVEGNATPEMFYEAGYGFGMFQKNLADFPASELVETIENFHHTPSRIAKFKETVKADKFDRVKNCEKEIEYILKNATEADVIVKGLENGDIPVRVTHNDTKLNNILFDKATKKAICVIDLDTVMPGSMLYDFGDAIRYGASTAAEDETDLEKVSIDLKLFESFLRGFTLPIKDSINKYEAELLTFSSKLLTYELGMRFLDDYLSGDSYFKIKQPEHNLIRAKNQLKICKDIDLKFNEMEKLVKDTLK